MKNTIFFLFLTIFQWQAKAQENVSFGKSKEIISPEIHADNTVTFRFDAKNASHVSVSGDFVAQNNGQPGSLDLEKDANGIWTISTAKLPSELYSYSFTVDGVKTFDPNNVYLIRDVATIVNVFLVGNGKAELYKVSDVPHGSVTRRWYDSPTLKTTRRMTVYTPPGYESGKEKFPVLYLLHGAGGDEEAWIALGRISQILDNLIAQKKAEPMIVVMPNGNASQTGAPGEAPQGMYKPVFIQPDMFSGNTESAFPDVVKFIDSNYRTKKEKASRAIAGLSMGGMHTLVISANNPEMFDYVGVFSSAMLQPDDAAAAVYANMNQKLENQKEKGYKLYWIGIGKNDFLYKKSNEFRARLDAMQFKYTYNESQGGHSWSNWRDYLVEFAPKLFR